MDIQEQKHLLKLDPIEFKTEPRKKLTSLPSNKSLKVEQQL